MTDNSHEAISKGLALVAGCFPEESLTIYAVNNMCLRTYVMYVTYGM